MANEKEIRTKIGSVKNTQKITKAMEMVAASKMRRTQETMKKALPYADKIVDFESALHASFTDGASDLAQKINETGDYNEEIEADLKKFVEDFKSTGTY